MNKILVVNDKKNPERVQDFLYVTRISYKIWNENTRYKRRQIATPVVLPDFKNLQTNHEVIVVIINEIRNFIYRHRNIKHYVIL